MRIWKLRGGDCPDGTTCPALYGTERGTRLVQGWEVTDPDLLAQLHVPAGEAIVEVPAELLGEASECST